MHPDEAVALGAAYYAVHCARHQEIVENGEFEHPPPTRAKIIETHKKVAYYVCPIKCRNMNL